MADNPKKVRVQMRHEASPNEPPAETSLHTFNTVWKKKGWTLVEPGSPANPNPVNPDFPGDDIDPEDDDE